MKKWIAAWLAVLVPLSATPAVWADTLPGGENESALVMVEKNGDVAITQDNFPDDTFRQMVKDEFDTNGDNVLSQGERDAVTALDVQEGPVASLKGVEVFPHLQVLNAQLCRLTELDLSQNTELEAAFVSNNRLVSLTLPKDNHTLKVLDVMGNRLTTLDVSGLKALTFLHVNDNFLTELDLSGCALTDGQGFIANFNTLTQITLPDNGTKYPLGDYLWEQNTPKGYTVQWYEDAGHSRPLSESDTVVCEGQTLYAAYEPVSYKVAFSSGSQKATGLAENLTLSYDQAGNLPEGPNPVDSDWQFVGWQIGSTVYAAGSSVKNLTDVDGKTVTATAVWQVKDFSGQSYQVVLHNGTESQVLTAYFGKAFTPNGSAFTKDHATLSGWSLTENGAIAVKNGGSVSYSRPGLLPKSDDGALHLYATWQVNRYTVTFQSVKTTQVVYGNRVTLPAAPEKQGYVFEGWADENGRLWQSTDTVTGPVALSPVYRTAVYDIVFDGNGASGGRVEGLRDVAYDENVVLPDNGFRKPYAEFVGWSLTENGAVVGSDTVQGAGLQAQEGKTVTLYAVWEDAGFGSEKPQVQATASTGGVKVQWTALPGAEGYRVYRDSGKGFVLLTTVKTLSYTDTGAGNGQAVRYAIEAVRGTAVSQKGVSGTVTRLSTPSVSVKAGTGSVTVSWGSVKGAKSYNVYRKAAGGSWQRIATTTSVKYTDKKAKKGTTYSYTVRAVSGSSQSAYKASGSVKAR
ncbi:MAG TPA: InlB B-repeat-containing protein [Firmicutes bacterium]|nr:InlB B-repeat-containing protein [Bacillota bacterium]